MKRIGVRGMGAGRQAEVGTPLAGVSSGSSGSSVPRPVCREGGRTRSYRAQQSDERPGIEETWLGDKAETASRPAAVLAR